MENLKAVITVRYRDNDPLSGGYGCVYERSFRTARMAMNYRDLLDSMSLFDHWIILEEVEDHLVGRWDGKSL